MIYILTCIQKLSLFGGGKEYLPTEVDYENLNSPLEAISNTNKKVTVKKENSKCILESNELEKSYEMPIIYYKGYKAVLNAKNKSNVDLEITKTKNGLIKITLPKDNLDGKITIWYQGTILQDFSYIISFVSISFMIIYKFKKTPTCN